jgi:plastocyanin
MTPLRTAFVMALAAAATSASSQAPRPAKPNVTIVLGSHYFQPDPIYLAGGVPVRLIFQNKSGKTHDFKAQKFFASARMLSGAAPRGEVELKKGRGTVIELVPARGRYRVHCSQPFHAMLGMTGTIIVS